MEQETASEKQGTFLGKSSAEPRRLEKQPTMELDKTLKDLPKDCKVGCK